MTRLGAWFTLVGVALALGALVTGTGVVLPALSHGGVDPNLARTWVTPMTARLAELVLAGSAVAAATAPRWIAMRSASTVGLVAASLAIVDRFVVLPRLHEAWARVDLAQQLPIANMELVDSLTRGHLAANATIAALLLALLAFAVGHLGADPDRPTAVAP